MGQTVWISAAAAVVGGLIAALHGAAPAAAEPAEPGSPLSANCAWGPQGQQYCDSPLNPNGSWTRCTEPAGQPVYMRGAIVAWLAGGATECQLVTRAGLPAGSPPHHMG